MNTKDSLVTGLVIAFLVLFFKASSGAGLTLSWEWDGVPHKHVLRLR